MLKLLTTILFISLILLGCTNQSADELGDKTRLLQLEHQWLEAEFSVDTVFLSSILDSTFMCIAENKVLTKQEILKKMRTNKNYRLKNDIVIDSFRLENVVINLYSNSAVVAFIDHTYGKKQGRMLEFKTQFYDVWIKENSRWKAVSSQAHY